MDEMKEIVTLDQANALFIVLAVALPLIGAAVGRGIGARRKDVKGGAFKGLMVGLLGPLNLILWVVYNQITDRLGLDTVKNLFVNLGLFVALGIGAGLIAGRRMRRPREESAESVSETDVAES